MPFRTLWEPRPGTRSAPLREQPGFLWEGRTWLLRRILSGGQWTIHDVINQPEVRAVVAEHWRLLHRMEEDRDVEDYIARLERLAVFERGHV